MPAPASYPPKPYIPRPVRFSFWPGATDKRPWQVQVESFAEMVAFIDTHRGFAIGEPWDEGPVLDVAAVDALLLVVMKTGAK